METAAERLIIALDDMDTVAIYKVIEKTRPFATTFKIGLSLFVAHGPSIVKQVSELGAQVFLDLKLHDIPMQVGRAVANSLEYGPRFLTVHAQGGAKMLREVAAIAKGSQTKILAVTVLTSLAQTDYTELGFHDLVDEGVVRLANIALSSGIDGLVSSPHELPILRKQFGATPYIVCPGVRTESDATNDQERVMTPSRAIKSGANALVIGRPITQAENVLLKAKAIHQEIEGALNDGAHDMRICP